MRRKHSAGLQKKSGTGNPLHTQEPVTVASFRTWRGWRECVARDRCLTHLILTSACLARAPACAHVQKFYLFSLCGLALQFLRLTTRQATGFPRLLFPSARKSRRIDVHVCGRTFRRHSASSRHPALL